MAGEKRSLSKPREHWTSGIERRRSPGEAEKDHRVGWSGKQRPTGPMLQGPGKPSAEVCFRGHWRYRVVSMLQNS